MIDFLILLQDQQPRVSTQSERYLLIYVIFALLLITGLVILFFIVFQKRKNKLIIEKIKQQQEFEEELSNVQLEIQEQTLKNIGQELHDNIGQLLSVASMNMSILSTQVSDDLTESFAETKNILKESLGEVRALSKSLNNEVIVNRGFLPSLRNEVDRLNKLKLLETELIETGASEKRVNSKHSVILLRIIQEFISNTVKYAQATKISIHLNFLPDKLEIRLEDNGKGFDMATTEVGSGLVNMKSRAALLDIDFNLSSKVGKGTVLKMLYRYRQGEKLHL